MGSTERLGDIATIANGEGVCKGRCDEKRQDACVRYAELYTRYGEVISDIASRTRRSA